MLLMEIDELRYVVPVRMAPETLDISQTHISKSSYGKQMYPFKRTSVIILDSYDTCNSPRN